MITEMFMINQIPVVYCKFNMFCVICVLYVYWLIQVVLEKRPLSGCVLYMCSEVNGFLLCFKMGKVPIETQSFSHLAATGVSTPTRYLSKLYFSKVLVCPNLCY